MKKIAPSILSADFTKLAKEIKAVEDAKADYLHIDVMDGHFVPNITVGPFIVEAARRATPFLLEPMMRVESIAPENFLGDVVGDLSARRGQIEKLGERATMKTVQALVPLAEMFGYATQLRSMTQGRGSYTMEFSNHARVPKNVAQEIIEGKSN